MRNEMLLISVFRLNFIGTAVIPINYNCNNVILKTHVDKRIIWFFHLLTTMKMVSTLPTYLCSHRYRYL